MAAFIGNFEQFNSELEDFTSYLERFEQFVLINSVDGGKVVSLFLTLIGPKVYGILKNLLWPALPASKSFSELQIILQSHYAPQRLIIAERFKFNQRSQDENETINDFVVGLKKLTTFCNYGAFLKDALRDRFVCGVRSEHIQRKLLAENNISFEEAVKIAQSMEMTQQQLGAMQPQPVHHVGTEKRRVEKQGKPCPRCNYSNHVESKCRAKSWKCFTCGKVGHTSKVCRNKAPVKSVELSESGEMDELVEQLEQLNIVYIPNQKNLCYSVIPINQHRIKMEIDTGAGVSVISVNQYREFFAGCPLEVCSEKLISASGKDLKVLGKLWVKVALRGEVFKLNLLVVKARLSTPLLGRSWLEVLKPGWREVLEIKSVSESHICLVEKLKNQYPKVFSDDQSSRIGHFKANIVLKENVSPIFRKPYDVPYKLLPKVEAELKRLVENGTLESVRHSEWASPIVVVPKKDSDNVRICIDYKKTVNTVTKTDVYPLPKKEDIFAKCSGKVFCTLDLKTAYLQLSLSEEAKKILVLNTHLGLFKINCLPYGVNSGPSIFQSMMDSILKGQKGVACYLDDVLISGVDETECLARLHNVMKILNDYNIRINVDKSKFLRTSVSYLGHDLDSEGIHPMKEKIESITQITTPKDVSQLKAYLGMLNYYNCFLPMLSSKLKKLYSLLEKNVPWNWDEECEKCFSESKSFLKEYSVLTYFDPGLPLQVVTDASPYGVGGVLCHVVDGVERPIYCVSATLSKAEQNYSQIEREALAVIFSVKKFHKYLYGNTFTIFTDAQALQKILGPKTGIPTLAASRMQRWALILAAYNYDLKYRKNVQHADALSRLPCLERTNDIECFYIAEVPLSTSDVQKASIKDITLSKVMDLTKFGWPNKMEDPNLRPFFTRRNELSISQDCLCWGNRVIIPQELRKQVLQLLHEQHPGIVRMKMLARANIWWPGMDNDIEDTVAACENCQLMQKSSPNKNLLSWPTTSKNFERVHLDFFHFKGYNVLLLVDSYTKWIEAWPLKSSTAEAVLITLRQCFATFGFPVEIVSDGGPPFNSQEFYDFGKKFNIKITKSPTYHPQSNGAAERSVQTIKSSLGKQLVLDFLAGKVLVTNREFQTQLTNFLFVYRNTPSTVTGLCPSEIMLKQKPRTRLTMLKPDFTAPEGKARPKDGILRAVVNFVVGETVLVKSTCGSLTRFNFGKVVKCVSPVTYLVYCNYKTRFVHADHLRKTRAVTKPEEGLAVTALDLSPKVASGELPSTSLSRSEVEDSQNLEQGDNLPMEPSSTPNIPAVMTPPVQTALRRSTRQIIAPKRLDL